MESYNASNHGHQDEGHLLARHTTLTNCQRSTTSSPGQVVDQQLDPVEVSPPGIGT